MNSLTKESFLNLPIIQQSKILYAEGTFIVAIRYYKYKINLYRLNDYLVEVFYNHKLDKIDRIQLLPRETKRMKFYTDQIKLPSNLSA